MENNKKKGLMSSRAFRKGSMSIILTVVVVALAILLNVAVTALSDRFPLSLDLTVGQDYSMGLEDTYVDFLKGVSNKINIIVCANESDFDDSTFSNSMISTLTLSDQYYGSVQASTTKYGRQAGVFIDEFSKLNPNFSVSYRDPNSATSFSYVTGKYPSESFTYGDIIVECAHEDGNERYQILHMKDYFSTEMNQQIYYNYYQQAYDITGSTLASNLTSAVYVTNSEDSVKIALYTGAGSKTPTDLKTLLERNNFQFEEVTSFAYISDDTKAVMIYAPTTDLNKNDVDSLDRYLKNSGNNGRNLIYVANTSDGKAYSTPVLNEYLAEWGINVSEGYVCETKDNFYSSSYPIYVEGISAGSDYTADLDNGKLSYPYGLYTGMKLSTTEKDYYTTSSILKSSDSAALLPNNAPSDWTPETAEISGPYDYIMQSSLSNTNAVNSNVVAFAGDTFFGLDVFEQSVYQKDYLNSEYFANAQLTLNIFNTLTGAKEQSAVDITTKTITTTSFYDSLSDSPWPNIISWVFIGIVPVIFVVIGIVVFTVRKRK